MQRWMKQIRSECGTAMLESVIVLPFLLLVMFAMFELGLAFIRAQVLTNAAREGAREASLFRPTCETATVDPQVRSVVQSSASRFGMQGSAISVDLDKLCESGQQVEVRVEFMHQLPVLSRLTALVGGKASDSQIRLSAQARMRNENL
jgi:Flp pilus assembly protein TadG